MRYCAQVCIFCYSVADYVQIRALFPAIDQTLGSCLTVTSQQKHPGRLNPVKLLIDSPIALGLTICLCSSQSFAKPELELGGRLMLDYASFNGLHNDDKSGSEWYIRRARLKAEHDSERGWQAEIELDFDEQNSESEVLEASFKYQINDTTAVQIGKFKESFGLENSTSSTDISSLERSVASDVFAPGRNIGVEFEHDRKRFYATMGLFQASIDDDNKSHNALTLRAVINPIKKEISVAHLGLSYTLRDLAGAWYEVNETMEISVGDKFVESGAYQVDQLQTTALEAALTYKRFWFQTEYFEQTLARPDDADDIGFEGYYTAFGMFISNHTRSYKNGKFDGFEPDSESALEIVARLAEISLLEQGQGMIANSASLTLNYYLDKNVRLLLNLAKVEVDSSNENDIGDGTSTAFRIIYKF